LHLQGSADDFLAKGELLPKNFVTACADAKVPVVLRMQEVCSLAPHTTLSLCTVCWFICYLYGKLDAQLRLCMLLCHSPQFLLLHDAVVLLLLLLSW